MHYKDMQLQDINIKQLYASKPVTKRESGINSLITKNAYFFKFLRIVGLFPIIINNDGTVAVNLKSSSAIYTGCLILIVVAFTAFNLYIIISNLLITSFTFEEAIFYGAWTSGSFLLIAHAIYLLEVKKCVQYLNNWKKFLDRLEDVTHRKPSSQESKLWIIGLLLTLALIIILIIFSIDLLQIQMEKFNLNKTIHFYLLSNFFYCDVILFVLANLWFLFSSYLKQSAIVIITDIENGQWPTRVSISEYTNLWMELRQLCIGLGNAFCYTYLYLSMFLFIYSLPFLYLGVYLIQYGQIAQIFVSLHSLLYITLLGEASHRATDMIGPQFEARLTNVLISKKFSTYEKDINEFIRTVSGSMPFIPIGGFFNFDRGINASLYSSVITYFIIILQFRTDELHSLSNSENETNV